MAGYGGGRKTGVNVSQYIADLNKEPSTFDFEQSEDNINIDEELAQFTNTEFLDFDSTSFLDGNASGMDFSADNAEGDVMKAENASKAPGLDFSKGASITTSHCNMIHSLICLVCFVARSLDSSNVWERVG